MTKKFEPLLPYHEILRDPSRRYTYDRDVLDQWIKDRILQPIGSVGSAHMAGVPDGTFFVDQDGDFGYVATHPVSRDHGTNYVLALKYIGSGYNNTMRYEADSDYPAHGPYRLFTAEYIIHELPV